MPFTVSVKAAPPSVADAGLRLVMTGVGPLIGNVAAAEGLPPVFTAVTLALLALAIRLAATAAVNWVELTKVVVSAAPFH